MNTDSIEFSGILPEHQALMKEVFKEAMKQPGFKYIVNDKDFKIFTEQLEKINIEFNKAERIEDNEVVIAVLREKYRVLLNLDLSSFMLKDPRNSFQETVDNILNDGVNIMIKEAIDKISNIKGSIDDIHLSNIVKQLLSKIDINSIKSDQLIELGFFLNSLEENGKEIEPYNYMENSNGINVSNIKDARKSIKGRKGAIKGLFSESLSVTNIDYFISMGEDLIRLGSIIKSLEDFIMLKKLRNERMYPDFNTLN